MIQVHKSFQPLNNPILSKIIYYLMVNSWAHSLSFFERVVLTIKSEWISNVNTKDNNIRKNLALAVYLRRSKLERRGETDHNLQLSK